MKDLREILTSKDKDIIAAYIHTYGTKRNFIGVNKYLRYWGHSKVKLYHLLGDKLSVSIPYQYKKNEAEIESEFHTLLEKHKFVELWRKFTWDMYDDSNIQNLESYNLEYIMRRNVFLKDSYGETIKIKKNNSKKMLQIQKGTKPMRAITKVISYFTEEFEKIDPDYKTIFEDFRLTHSRILNTKIIKGELVISIHPLDFLTMSDNNSNWSSCMSWSDDGCYRVGSVEMMNSNNALCCFIKNKIPYTFITSNGTQYEWNNKKYRTLVFCTKDIIMCGKSYPYYNEDISKFIVSTIRQLAKDNWNHTYSFGIEKYKDMKYIHSIQAMDNNRHWIKTNKTIKHNIIWDTNGMYNDMFNNSNYNFWCVRNKVKHNKIINVSGKSVCLCCGDSTIQEYNEEDNWDDECRNGQELYNGRYDNIANLLCIDCYDKQLRCEICSSKRPASNYYKITINGKEKILCKSCIDNYIRQCPCCNKNYITTLERRNWVGFYINPEHIMTLKNGNPCITSLSTENFKNEEPVPAIECCYVCDDCKPKVQYYFDSLNKDTVLIPHKAWNKKELLVCSVNSWIEDSLRVRKLPKVEISSLKEI